jgi:hypothetical protein
MSSKKNVENVKMLVHYLRDSDYVPFGCIVATSSENIGISICNTSKANGKKPDHFSKKRAREIALGRALLRDDCGLPVIPNKKLYGFYGFKNYRTYQDPAISLKDYIKESIERMKDRAKKYFKEEQSVES